MTTSGSSSPRHPFPRSFPRVRVVDDSVGDTISTQHSVPGRAPNRLQPPDVPRFLWRKFVAMSAVADTSVAAHNSNRLNLFSGEQFAAFGLSTASSQSPMCSPKSNQPHIGRDDRVTLARLASMRMLGDPVPPDRNAEKIRNSRESSRSTVRAVLGSLAISADVRAGTISS